MHSILLVLSWVCFGILCSMVARKKNRNNFSWFFLGLCFGLIALIVIYFLKPIKLIKEEQSSKHLSFIKNDKNYWYYLDSNKNQIGPMSFKILFENYLKGQISANTYVWNDTMENWEKINKLSIFSNTLKQLTN